jgi:tRNA(fMet)-specific endonuclease VapC
VHVDTNFIITLMRESGNSEAGPATRKLQALGDTKVFMPLFVLCELRAGLTQARNQSTELAKLEALVEFIPVVYPNASFAMVYSQIEAQLRKRGRLIPLMDMLIATIVKCEGVPLLTRDTEHFLRIPGVVVEEY